MTTGWIAATLGRLSTGLALLGTVAWLAACSDDGGGASRDVGSDLPASDAVPDLIGRYSDGFQDHRVVGDRWTIGPGLFHIDWVSNASAALVAQNDADNEFSPGLWSRFNWTTAGDGVWYCQVAFDAASREAALEVGDADPADLAGEGCGGFSWSRLTPLESDMAGRYTDGFVEHEVTATTWTQTIDGAASVFHIVQACDCEGLLTARNDDGNDFSPGKYSLFEWTRAGGTLYVCQTVFDADSRAEAVAAEPADASDPANDGCSGFPWSAMTPL